MEHIDYIEKDLMKYRDGRPMRRIDFLGGWCIFFCLLMALVPMVVLRFFTGVIFGDEIINNLYYLLSLYIICFVVVLWYRRNMVWRTTILVYRSCDIPCLLCQVSLGKEKTSQSRSFSSCCAVLSRRWQGHVAGFLFRLP